MSVTAVFNQAEGRPPRADNMIRPRAKVCLRGDQPVDESGVILAGRVVDQHGHVFWEPLAADNDPALPHGLRPDKGDRRLCPEVAFVGRGRLNL